MTVETATYIDDLDDDNPPDSDPRREGAAHLRLIKEVLKNTFPFADSEQFEVLPPKVLTTTFTFTNEAALVALFSEAVETGKTYLVELFLVIHSTTAGYVVSMNIPGTGTIYGSITYDGSKSSPPIYPPNTNLTAGSDSTLLFEVNGGSVRTAYKVAYYIAPTSSGTLAVKVKQYSADANSSFIGPGGFMRVTRLT